MNTGYKKPRLGTIMRMVLIGTVGIIALALGWLALNKNTEGRSKAALTEFIYKNWEFKESAEGWVGEGKTIVASMTGLLTAQFPAATGGIVRHDVVKTSLPTGNKYVKVALSLVPGISVLGTSDEAGVGDWTDTSSQDGTIVDDSGDEILNPETGPLPTHAPVPPGCQPMPPCVQNDTCNIPPPEDGWCPPLPPPTRTPTPTRRPPTPTPLPGSTTFTLTILYQLTGKTTWEKPVVKTGLVSKGSYAEYAVLLPAISPLPIGKLKLQVSGVKTVGIGSVQEYTMNIDYIRLTGSLPVPSIQISITRSPTSTPTRLPTPSCTPMPPCVINNTCNIPAPDSGWCAPRTPTPTRRPTPTPTPTRRPTPTPTEGASVFNEGKDWTCQQFPDASWCR